MPACVSQLLAVSDARKSPPTPLVPRFVLLKLRHPGTPNFPTCGGLGASREKPIQELNKDLCLKI